MKNREAQCKVSSINLYWWQDSWKSLVYHHLRPTTIIVCQERKNSQQPPLIEVLSLIPKVEALLLKMEMRIIVMWNHLQTRKSSHHHPIRFLVNLKDPPGEYLNLWTLKIQTYRIEINQRSWERYLAMSNNTTKSKAYSSDNLRNSMLHRNNTLMINWKNHQKEKWKLNSITNLRALLYILTYHSRGYYKTLTWMREDNKILVR